MCDRRALVIGLGNEVLGDDAAGVAVVRLLRGRAAQRGIEVSEHQGARLELFDAWRGRNGVVLVDSMRSGAPPGTVRRLDASNEPSRAPWRCMSSTHAFSLLEAIELARALERLPSRVILYAVEGRSFETGTAVSRELRSTLATTADAVLAEASALARTPLIRRGG